jgi:hypothetical protein
MRRFVVITIDDGGATEAVFMKPRDMAESLRSYPSGLHPDAPRVQEWAENASPGDWTCWGCGWVFCTNGVAQ